MSKQLDVLIGRGHQFFRFMGKYVGDQEILNQQLIAEGAKAGPFSRAFRENVVARDEEYSDMPYLVSKELLKRRKIKPRQIQQMIDSVGDFRRYSPEVFAFYGCFISEMMRNSLRDHDSLDLNTGNDSRVHVSALYSRSGHGESSYPWMRGLEEVQEHNRNNLLISNMASRLPNGSVNINGNVGNFFGIENRGASLGLFGECGWRAFYGFLGGEANVEGTVGHGTATYARGGTISVNGPIRSIGGPYTTAYHHTIIHNGERLPKENVGWSGPEGHLLN
jgi:hypothetical protein